MDLWDEMMEPDWFAMPTPPRTSGFSCSRLSLHCSRTCAAETRSAHPRSLLQDRRAWLHLRCAASALLPHQRPPACMRVVGCLAYAHACGNELSRPSVLRRASDPRSPRRRQRRMLRPLPSFALSNLLALACELLQLRLSSMHSDLLGPACQLWQPRPSSPTSTLPPASAPIPARLRAAARLLGAAALVPHEPQLARAHLRLFAPARASAPACRLRPCAFWIHAGLQQAEGGRQGKTSQEEAPPVGKKERGARERPNRERRRTEKEEK
jgi:hypothetical protein